MANCIKAELVELPASSPSRYMPRRPTRPFAQVGRMIRSLCRVCYFILSWLVGFASLVLGLSILATIPILQFASLGYLLDIAARVGHSGRIRDAFRDVLAWGHVGVAVLATWLLLLPLRIVADVQYSAVILGNPERAERIGGLFLVLSGAMLVHLVWAYYRGGRWFHFLWPAPIKFFRELRYGNLFVKSRDRLLPWLESLEVGRLFWLGLRGFFVALVWLVVPISFMVVATQLPEVPALLLTLYGGVMLAGVLLYLPFLQLNFAIDGRLSSGVDIVRVHRQFRRAPVAFWFALLLTLALALPLYILKAELIPREAAWLPSIVFVASVLPARLIAGWAIYRAERRVTSRHLVSRWMSRLLCLPVVLFYVIVVYLTQYVSWYGAFSLYEQHAFMLPIPFVGL